MEAFKKIFSQFHTIGEVEARKEKIIRFSDELNPTLELKEELDNLNQFVGIMSDIKQFVGELLEKVSDTLDDPFNSALNGSEEQKLEQYLDMLGIDYGTKEIQRYDIKKREIFRVSITMASDDMLEPASKAIERFFQNQTEQSNHRLKSEYPLLYDTDYLILSLKALYSLLPGNNQEVNLNSANIEKIDNIKLFSSKIHFLSQLILLAKNGHNIDLENLDVTESAFINNLNQISNNKFPISEVSKKISTMKERLITYVLKIKLSLANIVAEANIENSNNFESHLFSLALLELYLNYELSNEEQDLFLSNFHFNTQVKQFDFIRYKIGSKEGNPFVNIALDKMPNDLQLSGQFIEKIINKSKEIFFSLIPTVSAIRSEYITHKKPKPNRSKNKFSSNAGGFISENLTDRTRFWSLGLDEKGQIHPNSYVFQLQPEEQEGIESLNFLETNLSKEIKSQYAFEMLEFEKEAENYLKKLVDTSVDLPDNFLGQFDKKFPIEPTLKKIGQIIKNIQNQIKVLNSRIDSIEDLEKLKSLKEQLNSLEDHIRELVGKIQILKDEREKKIFKKGISKQISEFEILLTEDEKVIGILKDDIEKLKTTIIKNCDYPQDIDLEKIDPSEMFQSKNTLEAELKLSIEVKLNFEKEKNNLVELINNFMNQILKKYPFLDFNEVGQIPGYQNKIKSLLRLYYSLKTDRVKI